MNKNVFFLVAWYRNKKIVFFTADWRKSLYRSDRIAFFSRSFSMQRAVKLIRDIFREFSSHAIGIITVFVIHNLNFCRFDTAFGIFTKFEREKNGWEHILMENTIFETKSNRILHQIDGSNLINSLYLMTEY